MGKSVGKNLDLILICLRFLGGFPYRWDTNGKNIKENYHHLPCNIRPDLTSNVFGKLFMLILQIGFAAFAYHGIMFWLYAEDRSTTLKVSMDLQDLSNMITVCLIFWYQTRGSSELAKLLQEQPSLLSSNVTLWNPRKNRGYVIRLILLIFTVIVDVTYSFLIVTGNKNKNYIFLSMGFMFILSRMAANIVSGIHIFLYYVVASIHGSAYSCILKIEENDYLTNSKSSDRKSIIAHIIEYLRITLGVFKTLTCYIFCCNSTKNKNKGATRYSKSNQIKNKELRLDDSYHPERSTSNWFMANDKTKLPEKSIEEDLSQENTTTDSISETNTQHKQTKSTSTKLKEIPEVTTEELERVEDLVLGLHWQQERINSYFYPQILTILMRSVISTIVWMFIMNSESDNVSLSPVLYCIYDMSTLIYLCVAPETTIKQLNRIETSILALKIKYRNLPEHVIRLQGILDFIEKWKGFNLGDYVTLSRSALVGIISSVTTYIVILLQFKLSENHCDVKTTTNSSTGGMEKLLIEM